MRYSTTAIALIVLWPIRGAAAEITYSVQTVAGSSQVGDGGSALQAQLSDAQGLAVDRFGNVYIADPDNHRVRRVTGAGIMQTVAGDGYPGFSGDGGPAAEARLNAPYGVAADAAGNVYIADLGNNRVRKVASDGMISTVAGTGQAGSEGDRGPALAAQLNAPRNVLVDGAGNLYISEFAGHRIRRVAPDGVIQTIAGTGTAGGRGDGGAGGLAELKYPAGMAIDFTGALYIADSGNQRIRVVFNGVIGSLAIPGISLSTPTGIATDGVGGVYIADSGNRRILRRTSTGAVNLVAGGATLDSARDVANDGLGNLLIADGHRVRLLTGAGYSTTLAGDGTFGFRGDGGPAALAVLNGPGGVAVDAEGSLYIGDERNHRVRKVTGGAIWTVAGTGVPASPLEGLPATSTPLTAPEGLFTDPAGVIWITERFGNRVRKLTPAGTILTVAGNGTAGFNGDSRPATTAQLQTPGQAAVGPEGNLYIADSGNSRIRRVTPSGIITTFAGTGTAGFSGDGGQAIFARLNLPRGIAFDAAGNLYIADTGNHRVRKVTPGGFITTVAGDGGLPLRSPRSVAVDPAQAIYIADTDNHRIVKRSALGALSVIAGLGAAGFSGDGGAALAAHFSSPSAIALDAKGNLYVADLDNNRIRKLTPSTGDIAPPVTQPVSASFLHGASLAERPLAPGQILFIAGDGIGPVTGASGEYGEGGLLPTLLAETQVLFDGRAAPLIEVQQNQIKTQVPYATAEQSSTRLEVFRAGVRRVDATLLVTRAAPGIFTVSGGTGPALVTHADGSLNGEANPADPGSLVTLFATGAGQTNPPGVDGKRSREPYPRPVGEIVVRVGGRPAEVLFAGESAGILQIDAIIPAIVDSGAMALSVSVGTGSSQDGVTVFVK